jgi:hypothetical protein
MRPDNSSLTLLFKSKKLLIYTPLLFSILVAIPSLASAQSTPVTYSTPDYVYPDNNGYYNVKDEPYGCYGDGRHDDTACIKEAMDAAMRVRATGARHATLYFPEGTYLISDSLLWATYGNNDAVVKAKVDTSRGCITGFTIANGGSGYVAQPGLYITGGGGSGASFYTTLNSSGSVTGIQAGLGNLGTATCAGQGYKSVPTVKVLNWKAYLRFEGQNKANTIIKLTDNNAKFQNANCNVSPRGDSQARESCHAMIMTGNEQARNSFGLGESAYEDDVWNLTINTGSGNPGAIALDWVGSNRASVKNVYFVSGNGTGLCKERCDPGIRLWYLRKRRRTRGRQYFRIH